MLQRTSQEDDQGCTVEEASSHRDRSPVSMSSEKLQDLWRLMRRHIYVETTA